MGGGGAFVKNLSAEYMPAYNATLLLHLKVAASGAAQRLGALAPIPKIPDDRYTEQNRPGADALTRCPWHLIIQVPAAGSAIYVTWDNNTPPVVGGPGLEINPGGYAKFEHAEALLTPTKSPGPTTYLVDALTSIQIIGAAAAPILLHYSD